MVFWKKKSFVDILTKNHQPKRKEGRGTKDVLSNRERKEKNVTPLS